MLKVRRIPKIAHFKGSAVVIGGGQELTAKYFPLLLIEATKVRWTRLHGCYDKYQTATLLAAAEERLILLCKFFIRTPLKIKLCSVLMRN